MLTALIIAIVIAIVVFLILKERDTVIFLLVIAIVLSIVDIIIWSRVELIPEWEQQINTYESEQLEIKEDIIVIVDSDYDEDTKVKLLDELYENYDLNEYNIDFYQDKVNNNRMASWWLDFK